MKKNKRARKFLTKKGRDAIFVYGFLLWPILHFSVFWVAMNIGTLYNSFFEISIVSGRKFVGLENYKEMFRFIFGLKERGILNRHGALNSLSLIPLAVFINMPITLFFAYGIYKKIFGYRVFRTVLFLPAVISTVVLCLAFRLALDSQKGIVVPVLRLLGLAGDGSGYDTGVVPVGGWLGNDETMWGAILVFSVWTGVSGNLIYFTSSMARFPESVFESARIDGATELRQFFSIAMPMLWPTVTTMTVTLVAAVFSWFMPSLLLTDGAERATTIGLMITETVIVDENSTVICALGVIVAVFGAALILSVKKLMEKIGSEVEY